MKVEKCSTVHYTYRSVKARCETSVKGVSFTVLYYVSVCYKDCESVKDVLGKPFYL